LRIFYRFGLLTLVILYKIIGGPYGVFAGRDASRGLATFSLSEDAIRDEYDDLTDLNSMQMDSVKEWEMQFTGMYTLLYSGFVRVLKFLEFLEF
jgi:hypothetical protein